ncbi:hypothetical protein ACRE_029100 [Hapsidospora chrysogenum ATCC 11550]|uniref:Uncharacterized protein n=1 Tax=Hapsidospora chrysogenum (strain ATCC 11550 / CBS 779.69 / DSM 880 / IAM 14645 / JCM 23072 / IMI 49137) TaxID=857340 RepID=A0A086TA71_HAPC1|nr:hypothetical protein ACRE_029100 [Hapsidospora chrysogenum ATCC 11550]
MLAAHRDQENLVHSHQVPTKQQPKTPGARYPKTPLKLGQNDENIPTAFAGKTGLKGPRAAGGNDKILMTKGKGMVTPMEQRTRAPLGAKTTNAKARTGQTGGVKGMVKELERTQMRQPTAQKAKPKSSLQIAVKSDQEETHDIGEEPEYAPPRPVDLPYESDLLPPGGLSMEGLKKENLFRGYYQHFINPVDDNGVSRQDKKFNDEMKAVMEKAIERNERDLAELDWNIANVPVTNRLLTKKPDPPEVAEAKMARKVRGTGPQKQPSTIRARKAASALSIPSDTQNKPFARPNPAPAPARRPLGSIIPRHRASKSVQHVTKTQSAGNGTAEAASRTTLGYNRGRSASSVVHSRAQSPSSLPGRTTKTPVLRDDDLDLTITPARARRAGIGGGAAHVGSPRPQFMCIFDQEEDDEELPPMSCPVLPEDEEEEEFELKLDLYD